MEDYPQTTIAYFEQSLWSQGTLLCSECKEPISFRDLTCPHCKRRIAGFREVD